MMAAAALAVVRSVELKVAMMVTKAAMMVTATVTAEGTAVVPTTRKAATISIHG